MGLKIVTKRGDKSNGYFRYTFAVLVALTLAIVKFLPINGIIINGFYFQSNWVKITLLILLVFFLFRMCFYWGWFRNKIVGIFNKIENKEEVMKS